MQNTDNSANVILQNPKRVFANDTMKYETFYAENLNYTFADCLHNKYGII